VAFLDGGVPKMATPDRIADRIQRRAPGVGFFAWARLAKNGRGFERANTL